MEIRKLKLTNFLNIRKFRKKELIIAELCKAWAKTMKTMNLL